MKRKRIVCLPREQEQWRRREAELLAKHFGTPGLEPRHGQCNTELKLMAELKSCGSGK